MARVQLRDVSKVHESGVRAVNNVNIDVKDGEFTVLVGPSGCGKSTTLRMIAGLEEISSGDLFIDGERVNDKAPRDRDIAMVFQNYALYPHMTVYDNMAFGLKIGKIPKEEIERRVMNAAGVLDIVPLLKRKPKALSGGQRQRVAVGRAIVRHPRVFLFDEPLSNLDAKLRTQMRAELTALHRRLKSTMIYVTHDQVEAMTMGDSIVVMKGGVVQQIGKPLDLYENPCNRFVATFIGTPPMNICGVRVTRDGGELCLATNNLKLYPDAERQTALAEYVDQEVSLGIRAEDISPVGVADPRNFLAAEVEAVEPLGSETLLYMNSGTARFICRCDSKSRYQVGERVAFRLDVEKTHLFDPHGERSLFYRGEYNAQSYRAAMRQ